MSGEWRDTWEGRRETGVPRAASERKMAEGMVEDAYLSDLLSYSLERLNKEPELLNAGPYIFFFSSTSA